MMPYLVDRTRALWSKEVVVVLGVRRRRIRTRVILKDNSLYHTLTRTHTLLAHARTGYRSAFFVRGVQWLVWDKFNQESKEQ